VLLKNVDDYPLTSGSS